MDWEVPLVSEAGYGIDDRDVPTGLREASYEYQDGEGRRETREWCKDLIALCDIDDCKLSVLVIKTWMRNRANFLRDRWGFTVWRTVFTPGSDEKFAQALDIINQYVRHECYYDVNTAKDPKNLPDEAPNREIWQRFSNEVIEDRELDGASPKEVRDGFVDWIAKRGREQSDTSRYRFCILIDEDVLEALCRFPPAPEAAGWNAQKWQLYSMKAIDVELEVGEDADYKYCMMLPPWRLARLYFVSFNQDSGAIRDHDEGLPVYVNADW